MENYKVEDLTLENQRLLREIFAEEDLDNTDLSQAEEGVMIRRQTWDSRQLLDKRIHKVCMLLAKQENDVFYAKFDKFFKLSRVWRARLRKKYYGKARSLVMSSGKLYSGSLSKELKAAKSGNNPAVVQVTKV
jgi:hypothetical protein